MTTLRAFLVFATLAGIGRAASADPYWAVAGGRAAPAFSTSARANQTRAQRIEARQAATAARWANRWNTQPTRFQAVQAAQANGVGGGFGPLENLLDRYSLNAERFTYYHPTLGPWMSRVLEARANAALGLGYTGSLLPATAHNQYLLWRWGLNPDRFNHYHPLIGAIIEEHQRLQNAIIMPPEPIVPPVGPGSDVGGIEVPGNGGGGTPGENGGGGTPGGSNGGTFPPPIPEPSTIGLVGLGGLGIAWLASRRRKREAVV